MARFKKGGMHVINGLLYKQCVDALVDILPES
jgi:hypothetical protein